MVDVEIGDDTAILLGKTSMYFDGVFFDR